jgi:dUTP pyrophosphatase
MSLEIKVKYAEGNDNKIEKLAQGDWIDLRASEDVFIPEKEMRLVSLGVSMELPEGYEAIVVARSSMFKNTGCILTNAFGCIDNSYCGNEDIWFAPLYCLEARENLAIETDTPKTTVVVKGSYIRKGDRIVQFRIQKSMDKDLIITEVDSLDNENRGGHGSTGLN